MPEAHAVCLHDPFDAGAALALGAAPGVCLRLDHERVFLVVMERAHPDPVRVIAPEHDTVSFDESFDTHLASESVDFGLRDARHRQMNASIFFQVNDCVGRMRRSAS